MQPVGEHEALAGQVGACQQQVARARVLHELQAVGLVGQETVAASLEAETVDLNGLHRAAGLGPRVEDGQWPVRPLALQVQRGGQAADTGTDYGNSSGHVMVVLSAPVAGSWTSAGLATA